MPKNILIFSDGTGQAGGVMPDQTESNVYKLFRATRCGPENKIDPTQQFAFYDAGLGSAKDGGGLKFSWGRRLYNIASQATGLGITRNIIDCYAAILPVWEPGDRIYLFGFSRGAYTARCVGGVLGLCGVPTHMKDRTALKRDPTTVHAIAVEAVTKIYQFGSSMQGDPKKQERLATAAEFRKAYGSELNGGSNGVPYFVGVWDTVATLGMGLVPLIIGAALALLILSALVHFLEPYLAMMLPLLSASLSWRESIVIVLSFLALFYLTASFRYGQFMSLAKYRMAFYDTKLNPLVAYARHALSIDENRKDFQRVTWAEDGLIKLSSDTNGIEPFKQIWFSGVHSDIGGSYPEPESRLSDITLKWITEEARAVEHPILVDEHYLNLTPGATGKQHDERAATIAAWPKWFVWLLSYFVAPENLGWPLGYRKIPNDAPLHETVIERFKAPSVLVYGDFVPYRPPALRNHIDVKAFYESSLPSPQVS